MKVVCLSLMMVMAISLTAQVDYSKTYYPLVNRAELLIVEGQYHEALLVYQNAFTSVNFSPALDLYNAAVCALHLGDRQTAKSLLIRIIGRNVTPIFLWRRLEAFQEMLEDDWETITAYPTVITSENEFYRQELYDMEDRDQEFRGQDGAYDVYADTIAAIDQRNIERFRQLVEAFGFPGEHLFGAEKQILTADFPASIVLRHYFQGLSNGTYEGDDLTGILQEAVRYGELEPNLMAYLVSLQNNQELKLGGSGVWIFKTGSKSSGYVVEKYNEAQIREIDANRLSLGLDTMADYKRKAAFGVTEARNKSFNFSKYSFINSMSLDQATYDRILAGYETLVP